MQAEEEGVRGKVVLVAEVEVISVCLIDEMELMVHVPQELEDCEPNSVLKESEDEKGKDEGDCAICLEKLREENEICH
ncbi:hypothetical protein RJ641_029335 [Dillenia turbinata]|uniref:Uncharacterized protein n=1 Tax=Dillenia turbinata TaxID=194707 RepID=A0AAN8VTG6_9MAGN